MPYPNARVSRLRSARVIVAPEAASMKAGIRTGKLTDKFGSLEAKRWDGSFYHGYGSHRRLILWAIVGLK